MLSRFFTALGSFALSLAVIGCSSDGLRTNSANGTGGVGSGGAVGISGGGVDSGMQTAGGHAATGGTIGTGGASEGGGAQGLGGIIASGGTHGTYDGGASDAAGMGGAGGHGTGGNDGGGLAIDASTRPDTGGVVDGAAMDGPSFAGSGGGSGGGVGGGIMGSGGSGGADGGGAGASEVGRDAPSAGGAGGRGPQQPFSLSPQYIDLGNVLVGASVQTTITVTAGEPLSNLWVSVLGIDLSVDPTSTCTAILAAGATCIAVVNFTAARFGTTFDEIWVSNAGQVLDVPVQAEVENPAKLVIDHTAEYFVSTGGAATAPVTLRIANAGDVVSGPLAVGLSGSAATSFLMVSNTCAAPLSPLGSCSIVVIFNPQVADGGMNTTVTATLTVTDMGIFASVASAQLTGNIWGP